MSTESEFEWDKEFELVDGELVHRWNPALRARRTAPGYEILPERPLETRADRVRASRIGVRLLTAIGDYLKDNPVGEVFDAKLTFTLGTRECTPALSFVTAAHFGVADSDWMTVPDLPVEIILPADRCEDVETKIHTYFAAGVQQVWLLLPQRKTVTIYTAPTRSTTLTEDDQLTCEELLPEFRCSVPALFQPLIHAG